MKSQILSVIILIQTVYPYKHNTIIRRREETNLHTDLYWFTLFQELHPVSLPH